MKSDYYDGTKLLSMTDINNEKPEIYLCTGNRSAGKTTFFNRLCVNKFLTREEKFCLVYRYNYELDDCADKFFKDIGGLFFPGRKMTSKRRASGIFHELYIDENKCGYAVSLNSADNLKKYAHMLSDTARMLFDEFQSETNHYCQNEINKLQSVHTSIARGQGQQIRYVPVYMLSNSVSIINPYFVEFGISDRLKSDTKFLRGEGFVLEQCYNQAASAAQKESAFNRAFKSGKYLEYSSQNIYLNDNAAFIERPKKAKSRYLATLRYNGKDYGLREYDELGFVYCDNSCDSSYSYRITVNTDDHQLNYVMLKRNDMFLENMRYLFERGCFRFRDQNCKEAVLQALSY